MREEREERIGEEMGEDERTERIIAAALEVHRAIGPGLLESIYEECLSRELNLRGITFERQKALPLVYKGEPIGHDYKLDLVVAGSVIVELKSVETLLGIHDAQILTYMRLSGIRTGLLINFNVPLLKNGIRRFIL